MHRALYFRLFSESPFSAKILCIFAVFALASVQSGGSAPTPLYYLYQQSLHLTPFAVTLIFAAYPLSLLTSLLTIGSLSDHVGRRPVIVASMVLSALAMALFANAFTFGGLVFARIVQGVATGAAASVLGATILDVDPETGSLINSVTAFGGTTVGALLSSALVAYAPAPARLIYALLFLVFIGLAATARWLPETSSPRPGGFRSLRPHLALPLHIRGAFWRISPVNVAGWALGGFYLSLMPALFRATMVVGSPLLGGIVIASFALSGTIAIAVCRRLRAKTILSLGGTALAIGVVIILVGVDLAAISLLAIGTVIAGIGYGASFFGSARTILPLARNHERAGLLSAFYVQSYLAFSVPAVLIGLCSPQLGLQRSANLYGGIVLLLAIGSLAANLAMTVGRARREAAVS